MLAGGPTRLVNEKPAGVDTPATVAVTVNAPAILLAVNAGAGATPCVFVITVAKFVPPAKVPLAPLAGAVKLTVTPLTAFPLASLTVACSGSAKPLLIVTLCPEPAVVVTLAAGPAKLVSEKLAEVDTPATVAVTVYVPAMLSAVNAGAKAIPSAFVAAVVTPPAKLPLAPLAGAAKVTTTLFTGLPPTSFTVACSAVAKAVLIATLCGVPAVAVTLAGGPAWLVKAKLAGVVTPATAAITV